MHRDDRHVGQSFGSATAGYVGSGPVTNPSSVYDPSLVNDPSLLYDQPHNRGNKSGTSGNPGVTDTQRKR